MKAYVEYPTHGYSHFDQHTEVESPTATLTIKGLVGRKPVLEDAAVHVVPYTVKEMAILQEALDHIQRLRDAEKG